MTSDDSSSRPRPVPHSVSAAHASRMPKPHSDAAGSTIAENGVEREDSFDWLPAVAVDIGNHIDRGNDLWTDRQHWDASQLSHCIDQCLDRTPIDSVILVTQRGRSWVELLRQGDSDIDVGGSARSINPITAPDVIDLIGRAMDGGIVETSRWMALRATQMPTGVPPMLVLVHHGSSDSVTTRTSVQTHLAKLTAAITVVARAARCGGHLRWMQTLLDRAVRWQIIEDGSELLNDIAQTACELLDCERASIFMHDRRRGVLIGKPATGVQGNELIVPDSQGLVGSVLADGSARLWTRRDDNATAVNQNVDKSLNFTTDSLAAVAMRDDRDKIIGVFEAINRRGDATAEFDRDDLEILDALARHAATALQSQRRRESLVNSRDRLVDDAANATPLLGSSPAMTAIRKQVAKIAPTGMSVMIRGENGTGKDVLARQIHYQSDRRSGPFVAVNCAAIVETLLESELFGHEKGAFTDASTTREGKFETAAGGTLFLDEIGDMSLAGQSKLLRVLENRVVTRVGGTAAIPVDVRIIAATNQPLELRIRDKQFREDLYFRLNVISIEMPPLKMRSGDAIELAEHFIETVTATESLPPKTLAPAAIDAIRNHPWPGNVRQLRNALQRACFLSEGDVIAADDLGLTRTQYDGGQTGLNERSAAASTTTPVLNDATRDFQINHIREMIARCNGNMTEAASRMGLHRSNLYRKMRQLGMDAAKD